MKRILVDYKKLSHEIATLLIETYPYGYGDDDIIAFKNTKGEIVEAVELKTADTLYMVKISKSLSSFIANFDDNMEKGLESKPLATSKEAEKEAAMEMKLEEEYGEEAD